MKITKLFLLLIIINNTSYAQDFFCKEVFKRKAVITSESGLNLRKGPNIYEDKIITIPKDEEVLFCYDDAYPATIDGIKGTWVRSEYDGCSGYLFSGYLKVKKCIDSDIKLVIPNDGSMDNFPLTILCKPYQGFYKTNQKESYRDQYEVKSVELIDTTVDGTSRYFGKISNQKEQPLFLFSGLNLKNKIEGKLLNKMFYPYESQVIWNENTKGGSVIYIASAKGIGILNEKPNEMNFYKKIENYELWIRKVEKGKDNIDLLVFKTDLTEWLGNYQGGAWIYWIGHLNEDNIPDIIIRTSKTYKGWKYKLLLSDPSEKDKIYKVINVGNGAPC